MTDNEYVISYDESGDLRKGIFFEFRPTLDVEMSMLGDETAATWITSKWETDEGWL